jgi:hypothetical protein
MSNQTGGIDGLPAGFQLPSLEGFDFSNHTTLTKEIYAVNVSLMALVLLTLAMRLYSRLVIVKQLQVEDGTSYQTQ